MKTPARKLQARRQQCDTHVYLSAVIRACKADRKTARHAIQPEADVLVINADYRINIP